LFHFLFYIILHIKTSRELQTSGHFADLKNMMERTFVERP